MTLPKIGTGATYRIGTDQHPCTIVRVEHDGLRLGVVLDTVAGPGVYSMPELDETPERWFVLRDGVYRLDGRPYGRLELGRRVYHRDPDLYAPLKDRPPQGPLS